MKKQKEHDNEPLRTFLLKECKRRGLSLRRLSIKSGLSPGTAHGIIARKYRPSLYSLNQIADYLGVKREHLWQLGGLVKATYYESPGDTRLNAQLTRAQMLPNAARDLLVAIIEVVLLHFEKEATLDTD